MITADIGFRSGPLEPDTCPGCGRFMSYREAAEQGSCNDCNGGAYSPYTESNELFERGY